MGERSAMAGAWKEDEDRERTTRGWTPFGDYSSATHERCAPVVSPESTAPGAGSHRSSDATSCELTMGRGDEPAPWSAARDWSCEKTRCSSTLIRQAWAASRRCICDWRGRPAAIYLLGKALAPQPAGNSAFGALKSVRSLDWLEVVRTSGIAGLRNCSTWAAPPASSTNRSLGSAVRAFAARLPARTPSLLLADVQVRRWAPIPATLGHLCQCCSLLSARQVYHVQPEGMHAAHHKRVACGLLGLVRLLSARPRPGGALLLNFGSEWASWTFVRALDRLLNSCGIEPAGAMLLHFNLGAMLASEESYVRRLWEPVHRWAFDHQHFLLSTPGRLSTPRLRQSYWQHYFHELLKEQDRSPELRQFVRSYRPCDAKAGVAQALTKRARARASVTGADDFVLLGGQPRSDRAMVLLELARRGLLRRARWSAGRFALCDAPDEPSALSRFSSAGPFDLPDAQMLLTSRSPKGVSLVRELCAQVPKVLDVDPTNRAATVSGGAGAKHSLWRDSLFALTFETSMPYADVALRERLLFLTEKALKPLLNLRPLVMLGSAGALATLRALGFRTFAQTINETYDDVLHAGTRVSAAIDEVSRLVGLPREAWRPLIDAVAHNQRHLLCGGLRARLREHALHALKTLVSMADAS